MGCLKVKSNNAEVRNRRTLVCHRVLDYFRLRLSELSLFCYVDDETIDDADFEKEKDIRLGENTRGIFYDDVRISLETGFPPLPSYVEDYLQESLPVPFNQLIYVHGCACEPEVSLMLTFSHELQHFLQYKNERQAFCNDQLLRGKLQNWLNHPSEHEAMLVSKQAATALCDEKTVDQYIQSRIEIFENERMRWNFIRDLSLAEKYDFPNQVNKLVVKYRV